MNSLLNIINQIGLNQTSWQMLLIALLAVCISGGIVLIVSITARRFIDKELTILYTKKYNLFDKLMVVISSTLVAMLTVGLCVFGLGFITKTYGLTVDIFYEKLIVTYATFLTLTYSLMMPNHPKLRLFKIHDETAKTICSTLSRMVAISFCMISTTLIVTNVFPAGKIILIIDWASSVILTIYYFVELIKNHKLITNSFTIADSSEYSIAAKLTSYISDKFVLIATAGMFGMIIGDFALSQPPVRFYECLFDIYQFIIMLYLLQFVLSMIINKFISRIEQLEQKEVSRKKNLIWICDVTVMMTYFTVICYILNYIGMDVVSYLFHSKVVGSILIVFATIVIFRAFKEFMEAYQEGNFKSFLPLISIIFNFILFSISGLIILENLGVETAPILASFTVINAAVAWAAQDVLKSFIQGIMLLIEKDLLIGDYVCINGVKGVVEKLSVRITTLRCIDGSVQIIPYNQVNTVTNFSRGYSIARDTLRICDPKDIPVAIDLLKETSQKILQQEKYIGKIYGDIDIDGVAPYNGKGIEIKWSLMTANGVISLYFKDELYMEISQLLREHDIQIPLGELYEEINCRK